MKKTGQTATGKLSEEMVSDHLKALGLETRKPIPDRGIDLEVWHPSRSSKRLSIQIKARNPQTITSYRWFQIRIPATAQEHAYQRGMKPEETWKEKVNLVDFFILVAVYYNEMWVFSNSQTIELIKLNEQQYGTRPDNIITLRPPFTGKQKEMNLEAEISGPSIMQRFKICKNNFQPILEALKA